MPDSKPCILCGAPRPPHATKYCPACRLIVERINQQQANRRTARKRRQRAEGKPAEAPAPSAGRWTDADVVRCVGCKYWRPLGYYGRACFYAIDTPHLRGIPPRDCYGHAGTPYTPER